MRLDDGQGAIFELDIAGYQFESPNQGINSPSLAFSDCNWLMVRGKIMIPPPGKSWEFLDPCLSTAELESLAGWFAKISTDPIPRVISFMEPNLKLSFLPRPNPVIKIALSHECSSPWNKHTFPGFDELTFPISNNGLEQITRKMYDLSSKFPSRNQP